MEPFFTGLGEEAGERFQDILEAKPGPRPTQANDTDERGPSEVESGSPSMSSQSDDEEKPMKKIPYPKAIPFILSTEFCERFSFYGMRSKKGPKVNQSFKGQIPAPDNNSSNII